MVMWVPSIQPVKKLDQKCQNLKKEPNSKEKKIFTYCFRETTLVFEKFSRLLFFFITRPLNNIRTQAATRAIILQTLDKDKSNRSFKSR